MSPTTVPSVAPSPLEHPGAPASTAAQLSTELAAIWAGAPARWRHLVHHEPGRRWYAPLDHLALDHPALAGAVARGGLSAWLITWAPGTGLDLHDHGGSAGTLAVVEGTLSERYGQRDATGRLRAGLRRRDLADGSVTTFGPDHVHEVRNNGIVPAVSIHVYVPGLAEMAFYDAPAGARPGVRTRVADPLATDPREGS